MICAVCFIFRLFLIFICLSCTYLYILINHILINHVFLNLDPDKDSRPANILRRILDLSQSSI